MKRKALCKVTWEGTEGKKFASSVHLVTFDDENAEIEVTGNFGDVLFNANGVDDVEEMG